MVVHNKSGDRMRYQITGIKDINNVLIPFLEKYPLLSSKFMNYQDFKIAVNLVNNKEHLTLEGIEKLKCLAKSMNTGRSFEDKFDFCKSYYPTMPINPQWVLGFVDGEGSFGFQISTKNKNVYMLPSFSIVQNTHDVFLLKKIQDFFNCGLIHPKRIDDSIEVATSVNSISSLRTTCSSELIDIIIPFFDKYSLLTTKSLDYFDWKTLIYMKKAQLFRTEAGLNKMLSIKSNMNRGRTNFNSSIEQNIL